MTVSKMIITRAVTMPGERGMKNRNTSSGSIKFLRRHPPNII